MISSRPDTSRRSLIRRPSSSPGSSRRSRHDSPTVSSRLKSMGGSPTRQAAEKVVVENKATRQNKLIQLNKVANRMADQANMKYKTMYELYRRIDEDGDGKIDINEFDAGLKRCGFAVNRRDTEELYSQIDRDNSRTIDYPEFIQLMSPKLCQFSTGRLALHANIRMDTEVDEFEVQQKPNLPVVPPRQKEYLRSRLQQKVAIRTKSAEVASQLLAAFRFVDPRKDGYITYDEFRVAVGPGDHGVPGLNIGLTDVEVEELISMCDSDRDGCISLTEFVTELVKSNENSIDLMTASRNDLKKRLIITTKNPSIQDIQEQIQLENKLKSALGHLPPATTPATTEQIVDRTLNMLRQRNRARGGLKKAFQMYDADRSGRIDPNEFRNILSSMSCHLSDPEFEQLWHKFDRDGDGTVVADEFCDAVFRDNETSATSLGQRGLSKFTKAGKRREREKKQAAGKKQAAAQTRGSTAPASSSSSSTPRTSTGGSRGSDTTKIKRMQKSFSARPSIKQHSIGPLFDPMEWSKKRCDEEMGSTFVTGRPVTRQGHVSSRSLVQQRERRSKKVSKMYANGMRPKTAGMEHTKRLMESLEPTSKRVPFRREYSPAQGLLMTEIGQTLPRYDNPNERFLTTSGSSLVTGEEDRRRRHAKTIRFKQGQKTLQEMRNLHQAASKLGVIQGRNNRRSGARSKIKYLNYVMKAERDGPCRKPGKRMWHHTIMPGAVKYPQAAPHPW